MIYMENEIYRTMYSCLRADRNINMEILNVNFKRF